MANEMRDRLLHLIHEAEEKFTDRPVLDIEKFVADHLIENGVVVLPCRSGDYVKWYNGIDYQLKEVEGFIFNNNPEKHLRQRLILEDCQPIFSHEGILGYMPKAEAEQKLKEMRGE